MPITLSTARVKSPTAFEMGAAAMAFSASDGAAPTLTDHLHRIANYGARQRFTRNELIFNQGDPADFVYKMIGGTVRLCRYTPDGRRAIVDFLVAGDLLGFVEEARQPVAAEAVTDVTLIAYPRLCFERLAAQNMPVRTQLLRHFSNNLASAQQHLMVLGCQKAKERLASFFLRLADQMELGSGDRLDLAMGRQDIADHLGLTTETVSRVIAALRDDGAILIPNSHQVVLRDIAALRQLASDG